MGSRSRRPSVDAARTGSHPVAGEEHPFGSAGMDTDMGTFRVQQEARPDTGGRFSGSEILVEFVARHPVVGEFSLVQAVRTTELEPGSAPRINRRSDRNAEQLTAPSGWRIDNPVNNHPAYGNREASPGMSAPHVDPLVGDCEGMDPDVSPEWLRDHPLDDLSELRLRETSGDAQVGHRYVRGAAADHAPAGMHDEPGWPHPHEGMSLKQEFETTVLVTAGPMAGTYLGAIQWGHRVDGDGSVVVRPAAVTSRGAPSEAFDEAAEQWNGATTEDGPSIDLPSGD